ncbi:hypothetical protein J7E82_11200 [Arthrobacter sp. ISL-30]|nr:hypothetical protein [Arthrobacter sp. ISL-30]
MLSPIGWGQRSRPFSAADPLPLFALIGAAAVLALAVVAIRRRRDLGESPLRERAGRERAGVGGRSLLGLAWRLQRSTLSDWCIAAATLGTIAGGLGPLVSDVLAGNESLKELIGRLVPGSRAEIIDVLITALLGIAGVLAAAAGIQAVLRLRAEEAEGRAELLLATPRSRTRWLGANLTMAAVSALAVAATAGVAAAVALALSGVGSSPAGVIVMAALAHVPGAAVFLGAASWSSRQCPASPSRLAGVRWSQGSSWVSSVNCLAFRHGCRTSVRSVILRRCLWNPLILPPHW